MSDETPWAEELEELQIRLEFSRGMGGTEGIDRQHSLGKLTVRERIEALADPGTFREFGALRGEAAYDEAGGLAKVIPRAQVDGSCRIDGRKVVLMGGDFTVRGGSAGGVPRGPGGGLGAGGHALQGQRAHARRFFSARGGGGGARRAPSPQPP